MNSRTDTVKRLELSQVESRALKYMNDVYLRMMLALAASALIAYFSIQSGLLIAGLETLGRTFSLAIFGTQLLTVIAFQGSTFKMRPGIAQALFALYAAVTGLTLGLAGLIYTLDSLVTIGLAAAFGFASLVAFGKMTKRDLGPIGTFCIMGLTMLLVYSLGVWVMGFFGVSAAVSESANKVQGLIGSLLFAGITAYEAQRLKHTAFALAEQTPSDAALDVYVSAGALNMYMNFIGLFLSLLRLFGNRR